MYFVRTPLSLCSFLSLNKVVTEITFTNGFDFESQHLLCVLGYFFQAIRVFAVEIWYEKCAIIVHYVTQTVNNEVLWWASSS